MEINGLPLHPLVVHAVVVLTPVAGLLALVYGLVPRWRWWTRWPLLVTAVVGAVTTYVAAISGDRLKEQIGIRGDLIERHEMWAGRLQFGMWVLAALAVIAVLLLPFRTRLQGGRDHAARVAVLTLPVSALLALAGVAVLVFVVLTGDAGAQMVWNRG